MSIKPLKKGIDVSDPLKKLMLAGVVVFIVFAIGVTGYVIIGQGQWSTLDCAYMTVITLTTVGYNEVFDMQGNPTARIFTMFLILFGMGAILFFVSTMTAFVVEGQLRDLLWRKKMNKALKHSHDHYIICGLGETGFHVAEEMLTTHNECVMIDTNEERLIKACELLDADIPYVVGDASDDDVLKEAGIDRAHGIIAACTEDKDNLFIIVSAKNLNSGIKVVTKSISMQSERKLRRAGADKVVTTNFLGGMRLASEILRPAVTNFLDRMMRQDDNAVRLEEVEIKSNSPFIGKSLKNLDIRRMMNLTVLAIEIKDKRKYIFNPEGDFAFTKGMTLICLGEIDHIRRLRKMAGSV